MITPSSALAIAELLRDLAAATERTVHESCPCDECYPGRAVRMDLRADARDWADALDRLAESPISAPTCDRDVVVIEATIAHETRPFRVGESPVSISHQFIAEEDITRTHAVCRCGWETEAFYNDDRAKIAEAVAEAVADHASCCPVASRPIIPWDSPEGV